MRGTFAGFAIAVFVALALAGCAGSSGQSDSQNPFTAPTGVQAGKGVIRGIVLTPALVPIKGALVEIIGTKLNHTTADNGAFQFTDVTPGTVFVKASKPGWTTSQQSVEVLANVAEPQPIKVAIEQVPGSEPRAVTLHQTGFIACSIGTPINIVPCGVDGSDQPDVYFDIDGKPTWIQTEIKWTSSQPAGDWLYVIQGICSCNGSIPPVGGGRFNETPEAHSLYVSRATPAWLAAHDVGGPDGRQVVVDVSASGPQPQTTNGSGVAYAQPFEVYTTFFYNFTPRSDWTFTNDGEYPVPH